MPTDLSHPIKRSIKVHSVESDVIIRLSEQGLEMGIPGYKTKLFQTWEGVAKAMGTPSNVPSYLMHDPLSFLKHFATKKLKKKGG